MLFALLTFDLSAAWRYNAVILILLPFAIVLAVDYLISLYKDKTTLYQKIPEGVWITLLVIVLFYGVLRNLPAFAFLAPG